MMLHKKSSHSRLLKLLALIPIVGIALALNARTVTDYVYDEPQMQVPVKKGVKKGTIKTGSQKIEVVEQKKVEATQNEQKEFEAIITYEKTQDTQKDVFDVVEQMPQYPGGPQELFSFLAKNIKYPAEAENAGTQGRVIVTFVVGKDGEISNAHVVKSVDPLLDAEALRVINAMPNWTPGTQSGKAVRVKYTVPITFRLDGGKPKEAPQATGTFTPVEQTDAKTKNVVSNLPGAKVDEKGNLTINGKAVKELMVVAPPSTAEDLITPSLMKPSLVIVDGKASEDVDKVMKSIDPKNIETMTVLKNKAAIEQYGEKAKDGVVIITTKK